MSNRKAALDKLDAMGISYELEEHPAAYTIEDIDSLGLAHPQWVAKNLFLRDQKGKRHFLVTLNGHKRADLTEIADHLGSGKLSFASAQRLEKYLGLVQGEVTPLGVLHDADAAVEVVFDRDLAKQPKVGVHPCDNTATLYLRFEDLLRVVEENGNDVIYLNLKGESHA